MGWGNWAWEPRGFWVCCGIRPSHSLAGDLGSLITSQGMNARVSEAESRRGYVPWSLL